MHKKLFAPLLSLALLTACASAPPLKMEGADLTLTPGRAAASPETTRGRRVAWGGIIVATHNLKRTTEIEALGYPLNESGRPNTNATAQHRFLLVRSGYLEPTDYRAGRLVTAVGVLAGMRRGRVGEATYVYPVLEADELYLWPVDETGRRDSNVHFGIGIGVIVH